ncbi:metalloregulator ArsR/SmtB family transcription factor [Salinispirillum sp. LH 10-3-1]|uniref:Metalloregulator ArsR/SmtB family transcription factor n=2 Tax=Salinispirillum sp. LH 10-3-1 TaxID=2952525 RepID=A0AB38YKV5_9GAMM
MTTTTSPNVLAPVALHRCLSDETRWQVMMLLLDSGELCVCELMSALSISQPKLSRHLAVLRQQGLVADRRQGQWVFYRCADALPVWAQDVLHASRRASDKRMAELHARLVPIGGTACC